MKQLRKDTTQGLLPKAFSSDETSYLAFLETLLEAVYRWLPDTTITYVSDNFCKLCGREQHDIIGSKWIEWVPEKERHAVMSHIRSLLTEQGPCPFEYNVVSPNGSVVCISCNNRAILNKGKKVEEIQSVARDITNQKKIELAFQESEQRFRDLADKSPVPIYLRVDGITKYANQSFLDLYGYRMDEIIGQDRLNEFVHPDDLKKAKLDAAARLSNGPGSRSRFSFRGITRSGKTIYVETYSTITSYENRPAVIGTSIDMTDHRRIEQELREYRDSLEKLVEERTAQLNQANEELRQDIIRRQETENALELKSTSLEEVNTALKVLLNQREGDRRELEEMMVSNVKELVLRYIEMLKETRVDQDQLALLNMVEANLNHIVSPFSKTVSAYKLTPKEMEIVLLVKGGRTTKEIARHFNVCTDAVNRHKYHIRKKLGLNKAKVNLRSYLMNLG